MHIWLTDRYLHTSGKSLSNRDLSTNVLNSYLILRDLATGRETSDPGIMMWKGHEGWLYRVHLQLQRESGSRALGIIYGHSVQTLMREAFPEWENDVAPPWWTDGRITVSHRAALYGRDKQNYSHFFIDSRASKRYACCPGCDLFWPTHTQDYGWVQDGDGLRKI
jgi:Pyrimidine dimer DNA glycosylase